MRSCTDSSFCVTRGRSVGKAAGEIFSRKSKKNGRNSKKLRRTNVEHSQNMIHRGGKEEHENKGGGEKCALLAWMEMHLPFLRS